MGEKETDTNQLTATVSFFTLKTLEKKKGKKILPSSKDVQIGSDSSSLTDLTIIVSIMHISIFLEFKLVLAGKHEKLPVGDEWLNCKSVWWRISRRNLCPDSARAGKIL